METLLLNYLKNHEGEWIKKVALYVIADEGGYSPETCGRTLRTLAENGKIVVSYYDGKYAKNLAKYSYNPPKELRKTVEIIEGKPTLVMK